MIDSRFPNDSNLKEFLNKIVLNNPRTDKNIVSLYDY